MKKTIAELRKRMEGLEGRVSTLEETGK